MLMPAHKSLDELENASEFVARHIGPSADDEAHMLGVIGAASRRVLIDTIVPRAIARSTAMALPAPLSEAQALAELRDIAGKNRVLKSFIGQGYHGTHTPGVILRNILENPAWYTAYTPYQAEISQGRLEALVNFQTMVCDLSGMAIANASMLDEATAAAEAMTLARRSVKAKSDTLIVSGDCHPQTIEVIRTRAEPLGIAVVLAMSGDEWTHLLDGGDYFAAVAQYPATDGSVHDFRGDAERVHAHHAAFIVAADLLALTLLVPPGEFGADIVVGNTQRFGVPMGNGGPHAAFLACRDEFKRSMPGRLVGVSVDAHGNPAYRLALQTREQHIRREKATSNICTAQVLLAVIASMYAVYHGPQGLKRIAQRVASYTAVLARGLRALGWSLGADTAFDTITVTTGDQTAAIAARAVAQGMNLRRFPQWGDNMVGIALDETTTRADITALWQLFAAPHQTPPSLDDFATGIAPLIPEALRRRSPFLTHPVFNTHHSETEMLRYIRSLSDKDLALDRSMIPLGSCTMKLNATSEMIPITWPEFANIHPFAPRDQLQGYTELDQQLRDWLCQATGYAGVSLQPNAGSQGEYAGLLAIRAFHAANGQANRTICLIPSSAHGTNPASAQMAGLRVVVTACDSNGNVDMADLKAKCEQHSADLAAVMITYPSTHGVFETQVKELCALVHAHGARVYVDGANMNALVGVAAPGEFGGDVSHLNLHKTFCIPHGGGGPGMGPIGVAQHLAPFLPGHAVIPTGGSQAIGAVSAAPWGSASILPISMMYIMMMGSEGLTEATKLAILNANYVAKQLEKHYPVLYKGRNGTIAHECIVDPRGLKAASGVEVEDIAKRLMDYGFHAPTISFPVAGTLMIEPTESESKAELDRFVAALIAIRGEIDEIAKGTWPKDDNPLKHAPHTLEVVLSDTWSRAYTRERAAFPLAWVRERKFWPAVGRIDSAYGDRNLVCSCPPIEEYASV